MKAKTIQQAIRNKRFQIQQNKGVVLKVGNWKANVTNCSLTGIGATAAGADFEADAILSNAVLESENGQYELGRIVFRHSNGAVAGFSTVDCKVPVETFLSSFLEGDITEINSRDVELSADKFNFSHFARKQEESKDIFTKCKQYHLVYSDWEKKPRYVYDMIRTPSQGTQIQIDGRESIDGSDFTVMGSNDYLGMANHPEVIQAAKDALDEYGFGSTGSPFTTGKTQVHRELEGKLKTLYKKEAVLLFNSGYAANIGALDGLANEGDLVITDVLAHASIQDGIKMSGAQCRLHKHNDMKHLEKILKTERDNHNGAIIATEGIFSMDGDVPPLKEIIALAKKYGARTYVDEAHSMGVIGPNGLGVCDQADALEEVDIVMGTFSKVCGAIGGFIAGPQDVIDWLAMSARSRMFSVSIPPSTAAAVLKSLEIIFDRKERSQKLQDNVQYFAGELRKMGVDLSKTHQAAVIPVVVGDEEKLHKMNQHLLDNGIYVVPITYPAVSKKGCRFRFTVMSEHSREELDHVIRCLKDAARRAEFRFDSVTHTGQKRKPQSLTTNTARSTESDVVAVAETQRPRLIGLPVNERKISVVCKPLTLNAANQ